MHQVFISLHCMVLLPDVNIFTLHVIISTCSAITLQQSWHLYRKMKMTLSKHRRLVGQGLTFITNGLPRAIKQFKVYWRCSFWMGS